MKKLTAIIRTINYRYFFTELLIVVAGILIAVMLNSWREDNSSRNREQFYLKSLKTDFHQSLASLNDIYNQNLQSDSSVKRLVDVLHNNKKSLSLDTTKIFRHLFGFNRFVPSSGTYKEIISTGSLQILRNAELRIALSSWDDMILRNRQLEDVEFWQYHLINVPYLNKHIVRSDFRTETDDQRTPRVYKTDFKKLFADPEFENILVNRGGAVEEADTYIQTMIEHVKEIIKMIDEDIND